jgi:predicted transcriptional regulator|tara:strand:+ start:1567 stop:1767 length:201 start_codon:yes stop_codon:yes gene_type:complete
MESYFETLNTLCNQKHINLRSAFMAADIPTSTFYRAKQRNDMRFDTALKVLDAINRIYALKTASDH